LPLPSFKRVIFGKDQLRLVIAQIRFPVLFRFEDKSFLAPFQEAIRSEYPKISQEHQMAMKISGKGVESAGETMWRFSERQGAWSVLLAQGALTIECRKYTNVDDLAARFERLLVAARDHLEIQDRTRLGLRFVNEFRVNGAAVMSDWSKLLNHKFVGFAGAPELLEGSVGQAFQEIRSIRADGTLVIRHGLLTGTTVEARPNEPAANVGPFDLHDLDYFNEAEEALDPTSTIAVMRRYNDSIYQMFRWALDGGDLFNQLEPSEVR
jgi:uncharacterized protein (TIGR04255 family)